MTTTKLKPIHKIACIALILVMALVVCIPNAAFAASGGGGSITIDGQSNETYTIYQIFDVTYADDNSSYSYKVTDEWTDFVAGYPEDSTDKLFSLDTSGYLSPSSPIFNETDNDKTMVAFAKDALDYANTNKITGVSKTADSTGQVSFEDLSLGWYLVDTSLGSLCMLTNTTPTAELYEKNPTPSISKEVVNEDLGYFENNKTEGTQNNAETADTLEYMVKIDNVDHLSSLVLHDTVSDGLEFKGISTVKVYQNNYSTMVNSNNYTVSASKQDGCSFEVEFSDTYLDTLTDTDSIIVTYEVTVTDKIIVKHNNEAYLTYGDASSSVVVKTETDTYGFELLKTDNNGNTLKGATFELNNSNNNLMKFITSVYNGKTIYVVSDSTQATSDIAVTDGDVYIFGLEEDTYTLTETAAPDGYNKLIDPITVNVKQTGTGDTWTVTNTTGDGSVTDEGTITFPLLTVENNIGNALPGTGGIGTTIFYIVGGVLVAAAAVVLITRRRMNSTHTCE